MHATRPSLRTFLLLLLALLVLFGAIWLVPLADGSQTPPADLTGKAADRYLERARKEGAATIFHSRYLLAQSALKRARTEANLALAERWGFRDFRRAEDLLDIAQKQAFDLWRETVLHQARAEEEARLLIGRAEETLGLVSELLEASLPTQATRSSFASAEMHLFRARTYFTARRFDDAVGEARASLSAAEKAREGSRARLQRYVDPANVALWRKWTEQAVAASLSPPGVSLVVVKEDHMLHLYRKGRKAQTFAVELGARSVDQKLHAGDRATPEGLYRVVKKKGRGQTKYTLALLLNYPNDEDRARFARLKAQGQITARTPIGGLIEIHGHGGQGFDWTDGCVALPDPEMERLYNEVPVGTVVAIVGADGDGGAFRTLLRKAEASP
ncbi:MAG: L,D-transpeptidase family protein [Acidobacteriota bacterium]